MTFGEKLKTIRANKSDMFGRTLSQEKASRLFNVSLATYRNWEADRNPPNRRSRDDLEIMWPELFKDKC
jgi:DNA-binding transcriptional regulator YiaG